MNQGKGSGTMNQEEVLGNMRQSIQEWTKENFLMVVFYKFYLVYC